MQRRMDTSEELSMGGIYFGRKGLLPAIITGVLLLVLTACSGAAVPDVGGAGGRPTAEETEEEAAEEEPVPETTEMPPSLTATSQATEEAGQGDLPTPTSAPTQAPQDVAFVGETSTSGAEAVTSGLLSVSDLGIGTVDASAPSRMTIGESGTVRLQIVPAFEPEDVEIEVHVTVTAIEDPVEVLNFSDQLRIYSIMQAQLSAPNFNVESVTPATQRLNAAAPAVWLWSIVPRLAGRQTLLLSVSVPIVVDGQVQEISTSPLRTMEFRVDVVPAPTPVPSPTAPTQGFVGRTADNVGGELLAAAILGALGAAATFLWRRFGDRVKRSNGGE